MRRITWTLIVLVAAATAVLVTFRGSIATWMMARGAERNLTTDPIAALPDGLHLGVCGAGSPLPDPVRSGPCLAVLAGERLFVVDAGSPGGRNLQRMRLPPERIQAVLLTHFHSDHIDGLGELALLRWTAGSHREPLPVYGPPGVERVVAGFNEAYALDAGYRTAHHGAEVAPPGGAGATAVAFPTPEPGRSHTVWQDDRLTVTAFRVDHAPATPAVGYRFDYAGRALVISGDTRRCDEVRRAADGADLLAHEALATDLVGVLHDAAVSAERFGLARITHDIPDYHATPMEAAATAAEAGVRHLLLYHIVPPLPVPGLASRFLEGLDKVFDGPVTLSRDGTFVSLPAGSSAVTVSQRL